MTNYLDTRPDEARMIEAHRAMPSGQFVPIAADGVFSALVRKRYVADFLPVAAITVADYVVGLELLGHVFTKAPGGGWEGMSLPHMPASWRERSHALQHAFDDDRADELVAFLDAREELEG